MANKPFKISNLSGFATESLTMILFRITMWSQDVITALNDATLTNVFGEVFHASEYKPQVFTSEETEYDVSISFAVTRKTFVARSTARLEFLTSLGRKYVFNYQFQTDDRYSMNSEECEMSREERERFLRIVQSHPFAPSDHEPPTDIPDDSKPSVKPDASPSEDPVLKKYYDALDTERNYLRSAGGTKYRLSNGKMILNEKGVYSYIFDMESELYVADSAPVTVIAGINRAEGSVLMCEGFQIIVQLRNNIGTVISTAYLSVEPWKLLDALKERLQCRIRQSFGVAENVLSQGPALATRKPIDLIPKGHDEVIKKAMSEPVTIIWGPPGTGKTHVMSELAIEFLKHGKRILVVSHSNVSVDGVASKVRELLEGQNDIAPLKDGKVLRYGYIRDEALSKNENISSFMYAASRNEGLSSRLDELQEQYERIKHYYGLNSPQIINLKKEIAEIHNKIREMEQLYVSQASIIATTISKVVVDPIFENARYDVVMFDEVSMAYVPQILCAATYAKEHIICVGDFMQLAPIAQSPEVKKVLTEDIFSFLGINVYGTPYYHPWLVMLDEQRRMHPAISQFPRKYVYRNLLRDHSSVFMKHEAVVNAEPFSGNALNLIDLKGTYCAADKNSDNSRFNLLSGFISFATALAAEQTGTKVGIITPYVAQTRFIRAMVLDYREKNETNVKCSTVHQFQGSESDVILFDAVESFPSKKLGYLMGKELNSIRRLINVAVTRARGKLITIANAAFWERRIKGTEHLLDKLLTYHQKGNVVKHVDGTLLDYVKGLNMKGGPAFFSSTEEYLELLEKDLGNARKKIVISIPGGELDPDSEDRILCCIEKAAEMGIPVCIKSSDYANLPENWKKYTRGTDSATFPLIVIDDHIVWYGAPAAKRLFRDGDFGFMEVCKLAIRFSGTKTTEIIKSFTELEMVHTGSGTAAITPKMGLQSKSGFAPYISKRRKCCSCKQPLSLTKGKKGTTILWCSQCKKSELIAPEEIQAYIYQENVTCPRDGGELTAGLGKYGLYVRCSNGHFMNPSEI